MISFISVIDIIGIMNRELALPLLRNKTVTADNMIWQFLRDQQRKRKEESLKQGAYPPTDELVDDDGLPPLPEKMTVPEYQPMAHGSPAFPMLTELKINVVVKEQSVDDMDDQTTKVETKVTQYEVDA